MGNAYLRTAAENIPGNETNSTTLNTKTLFTPTLGFDVDPGMKHLSRDDEARGIDEALLLVTESADPTWSDSSRGYPDVLGGWLSQALGLPVSTAGNGVITDPDAGTIPTGATRHVWTAPSGPSGASPQTFEAMAAYKDQSVFLKARGCATQQITIDSPAEGGMQLKRSGPALYLTRVSDPSLTPTTEALDVPPFERCFLTVGSWLASTAAIEDVGLQIDIPSSPEHEAGSGSRWPNAIYKGDTPIVISGTMPKQLISAADFDALQAATSWAAKLKWLSTKSIGATAYKYTLWVESAAAQYTDGAPSTLNNQRRIGASFGFKFAKPVSGASWTITLVNGTASYA